MSSPRLGSYQTGSPDELAAALCATLILAGKEPRIRFRFAGAERVTRLDIYASGRLVAILPTDPVSLSRKDADVLEAGIGALGRLHAEVMRRAYEHPGADT